MILLGLIGYPLSHSRSPELYRQFFARENLTAADYRLFPLPDISQLQALIDGFPDLSGLNVTIPHKQAVIPLLQQLAPCAAATGAVNTITISRNGAAHFLTGYNTDVNGFSAMLYLTPLPGQVSALVLGTGGASRAVISALKQRNIPFTLVSRTKKEGVMTYQEVSPAVIAANRLIINTTPLGMTPAVDTIPDLPWDHIGPQHFLLDLVYNPETTLFMRKGTENGAFVMNGMVMLQKQAEKAWEIFKNNLKK